MPRVKSNLVPNSRDRNRDNRSKEADRLLRRNRRNRTGTGKAGRKCQGAARSPHRLAAVELAHSLESPKTEPAGL
jgi:hypothetical protein